MPRKKVDTQVETATEQTPVQALVPMTGDAPSERKMPELVRKCENYDPNPFMSLYEYPEGSRTKYLEVRYRVDWFLHWCQENGKEAMFDESEYAIHPELGLVVATCAVYLDGELAAKSTAGREYTDDERFPEKSVGNAIQTAFTFAKGRALANLGFGTINGLKAENGEIAPPDAGNKIVDDIDDDNPFADIEKPDTVEGEKAAKPDVQPVASTEAHPPVSEAQAKKETKASAEKAKKEQPIPTTLEEAQNIVFSFGKNKGRRVGEVWVTDPGNIRWLLSDAFERKQMFPAEIAACRIVSEQT